MFTRLYFFVLLSDVLLLITLLYVNPVIECFLCDGIPACNGNVDILLKRGIVNCTYFYKQTWPGCFQKGAGYEALSIVITQLKTENAIMNGCVFSIYRLYSFDKRNHCTI